MTVSLTGTGGLFTRLGKLGGWQLNVYGVIGTTAPSPSSAWGASGPSIKALGTAITDIDAQFFSAQQQVRDLLYATRDNVRSTLGGSVTAFTSLASSTLTTQVQDDAVLPSPSVETCIAELVRQMELSGSVVESNLTTVAVAADSNNNGTAQLVASLLQADGVRTERCYVEVGEIICTGSAQAGSATAGSEPLSVLGEPAVVTTAYDWPKGSGGSGSLLLTNPTLDNSGGNLLTNSDFDDYTATNDPDNWALDTGTAGATI
ncbi:MAG TPA: hypothetical protein VEI97_06625, partial [bacterium]|nr:hypothetical protein [bacterium]